MVSKKGRGQVVTWTCYLSDEAVDFFADLTKGKDASAPLLPNDLGEAWRKNGYRRELLEAKEKAGMPDNFDLYAFRHYHISKALKAGIQAQVIAENCGTSVRMLEKHYAKFTKEERRAMMNTVALGGEG